ncbi:hypothetical protein PCASD_15426 [Puccinia coronata f. sp. avenae]|uniref:CRA domain-containing protein n=1 Tax=Puccinia coronata f. sp. avenae TaxID=200324 RepID=A0A2N5U257_9BASI|nr:hypothetical protein PCASD_15426 [Puccinia coronata f. sp. avenae]
MSHRYLTDPSLSSTNHALHSSTTNPAMLLNEYGPRRPTDPVEMRRLVLDYLCHHCFVDTASAFARESASNCNESRSEIMSDGPAHTTSKSVSGGDQSHQSTLAVKDTVVERTVRFDTDDDGDAEMGDLADVSCSRALPHPDTTTSTGISANAEGVALHPTNDTSLNHEMTEDPLFNRPAESYPDWTAQDIQTTRIRLAIKEYIVAGKIKEAIKLIETHFPAVLGATLTTRSGGSGLPSPSIHSQNLGPLPTRNHGNSNGQIPSHILAQRKNRSSLANRPLRGTLSSRSGMNSSTPSSTSPNQSLNDPRQGPSKPNDSGATTTAPTPSSDLIPSHSHLSHGAFGSLNPAHVALNLQIQFFVEFVRSISQSQPVHSNGVEHDGESHARGSSVGPSTENAHATNGKMSEHAVRRLGGSSPTSHSGAAATAASNGMGTDLSNSVGALSDDTSTTSSSVSTRTTSLALSLPHCRALHDYVHQLPEPTERAIFAKELENVAGLLAYVDPWDSPVRKYLDQSRRDLLAHRVNAAILVHLGRSPTSILQLVAQQTCFTWSMLNELDEQIPCPTSEDKSRTKPISFFNLHEFVRLNDFGDSQGCSATTISSTTAQQP